ncbi:MAG: cytidylate kinase-like family protein [Sedimentisphaerales bacterium]|nr:cytidylate kinase-like family protein [Sedimentisphaerales bacterium]
MPDKTFKNKEIGNIVNRQMSQWELSRAAQKKVDEPAHLSSGGEIDYITISRDLGSGGIEVAKILSDLIKWQIYDKEILDYMAEDMNVHVKVLESVDEQTIGWIRDWVMPVFTGKSEDHVQQLSYYKHLSKVLLVIAKHKCAIIIGRGAGLMLPRDKGLQIRITAPFELRCQRYAQENNMSVEEARAVVSRHDITQIKFIKNFTGKDVRDSCNYDIVFNTEKISPVSVAKVIWRAFDQRMADSQKQINIHADEVEKIVEEQIQHWEQWKIQQDTGESHIHLPGGQEIDYITIGREVGSGAPEIARKLGELMEWDVYDRDILNYMSKNMKVHVKLLMSVDERTRGWISNRLLPYLRKKSSKEHIKQARYYQHLGEVLLVIAMHGRAIIIGRGAGQILPKEKGLRVHLIAPLTQRVRNYARKHEISYEKAESIVRKADKEHKAFLKDFLGKDVNDALIYDIVFNTEKLDPDSVAKLIWRAFDQRIISKKAHDSSDTEEPDSDSSD